ncbi:hypothetical protein [Streptomyces ramulosus]|uniref:hypothetical protein n=1 Tax=Streptomyces TaxID=1883 RepID=UPI0031E7BE52
MRYEVHVGRLTGEDADPPLEAFYTAALADSTYFEDAEPPPTRTTWTLSCPTCDADRDLTVRGTRTYLESVTCPAGHTWTPWPGTPARGRQTMEQLVEALDAQLS